MKITKFPQSCCIIESQGKKILIDPSTVKFDEKFVQDWKKVDAIFVTHKHGDHIHPTAIKNLNVPIYSTSEVANTFPELSINIVKAGDVISIGEIKIEVVKAVHGYISKAGEIIENVGFIIDDGKTRLYVTSDTVRFENNYKADAVFADVTAFDASMNLWGATQTMQDVGAKLLIVAHQDTGRVMYDKDYIKSYLNKENINFIIPEIYQTFEI